MVWLWEIETGASKQVLGTLCEDTRIIDLAFISEAKIMALCLFRESRVMRCMVWNTTVGVGTMIPTIQIADKFFENGKLRVVCLSPDGKLLAVTDGIQRGDTIQLWDTLVGGLKKTLVGHSAHVELLSISPDSKLIVSSSADGIIKLWDTMSGSVLHILNGPSEHRSAACVAISGQLVASIDLGAYCRVWDTLTGSSLWVKHVGSSHGWRSTVAVSPNNKLVACTTL